MVKITWYDNSVAVPAKSGFYMVMRNNGHVSTSEYVEGDGWWDSAVVFWALLPSLGSIMDDIGD